MFALSLLACVGCRSEAPRNEGPRAAQSTATVAQPKVTASGPLGGDRPVRFFSPAKGDVEAPLVIVLHGYGGDGSDVFSWSGLAALTDVHVLAPDGTVDATGRKFWNANDICCDFDDKRPDDVRYLTGLVDDVSARVKVDAKRVYTVGLSNGGAMAMRLACDASDKFAAVVSFAGPSAPEQQCSPKLPISIRLVHGTADRMVPYQGGERLGKVHPNAKGILAAVRDVAKAWAAREGCGDKPIDTETADWVPVLPGAETHIAKFPSCSGGAVELATIEGGPHIPPLSPAFATSTWAFLSAHSR